MSDSNSVAKIGDNSRAGIGMGIAESMEVHGYYHVQCHDAEGNLVWEDDVVNLVPTVGKNFTLDTVLAGSAYTAAWFMGLVDGASAPTFNAADTSASHAGWTESTVYSNATRVAPAFSAAAAGVKSTSAAAVFNIHATATIAGTFLISVNTKGGTTGTIYSEGSFTGGNQPVVNGNTLSVTYSSTLS